jgi:hypothetical protein
MEQVKKQLLALPDSTENTLAKRIENAYASIAADYRQVLGGLDTSQGEGVSMEERGMGYDVTTLLLSAGEIMKDENGDVEMRRLERLTPVSC